MPRLSRQDLQDLRRRGLTAAAARRQARLLSFPPRPPRLLRPARLGDGIESWTPAERIALAKRGDQLRREGRLSVFIPASGAATRLFQNLALVKREAAASGAPLSALLRRPAFAEARAFLTGWKKFALRDFVKKTVRGKKTPEAILEALFAPGGPAHLPKGLLPFHLTPRGPRTALEEHLANPEGRVHLTVSREHLAHFRRAARGRARFSVQDPSTDTLALAGGQFARRPDGKLLFRPGGHGSLLRNLQKTRGDIVLLYNIDNIGHFRVRRRVRPWRLALAGRLSVLQDWARHVARALELGAGNAVDARQYLKRLGQEVPAGRRAVLERFRRPWRVVGVVKNNGEPGGGPYWVRGNEGDALQIVESAQVADTPAQRAIFRRATHFNPVDMAVGLKDLKGRGHHLERYREDAAVIVGEKVHDGRALRTLEWPGLWNGGMARWNTVFVEIPAALFNPVKTIGDLLRSGHRI